MLFQTYFLQSLIDVRKGFKHFDFMTDPLIEIYYRVSEVHREVTPPGEFEVPEVLEVHVVPSDEVRMVSDSNPCFLMVPELPTATKILFP